MSPENEKTNPDGGASVSTAELGLLWQRAPNKTQWGEGMMEALIPLGVDHTLRLYTDAEAISMVENALGMHNGGIQAPCAASCARSTGGRDEN